MIRETRNTPLALLVINTKLEAEAVSLQQRIKERRKSHGRTVSLMHRLSAVRHRQIELENGASPWPELGRA